MRYFFSQTESMRLYNNVYIMHTTPPRDTLICRDQCAVWIWELHYSLNWTAVYSCKHCIEQQDYSKYSTSCGQDRQVIAGVSNWVSTELLTFLNCGDKCHRSPTISWILAIHKADGTCFQRLIWRLKNKITAENSAPSPRSLITWWPCE